jgi:hypothetical protein
VTIALFLFYVAGVWSSLVFTLLCLLDALLQRSFGLLVWMYATFFLGLSCAGWMAGRADPLNRWPPETNLALAATLYLCVPLSALAATLLAKPEPVSGESRAAMAHGSNRKPTTRNVSPSRFSRVLMMRVVAGAILLAGATAVWVTFDEQQKTLAEIDYYSECGQYDRVLQAARRAHSLDVPAIIRLHSALYHRGRLAQDLFSFPAQSVLEPLPGLHGGTKSCRPQSETLFEMGLVNDAEHLAHEALESEGNRPDLLRLLAQVNVLKGRPKAAAVFLNVLAQVPFQRRWSQAYLRKLQGSPQLPDDQELAQVRARMPRIDVPHEGVSFESLADDLLEANHGNQMAFEYLMAHYLIALDLKNVVEHLGQLDNFGYVGIPRLYEEALLLYQQASGVRADLKGRQVRPETIQRFQRFSQAMEQKLYDSAEGRKVLTRDFGDTFWYFFSATISETRARGSKGGGA